MELGVRKLVMKGTVILICSIGCILGFGLVFYKSNASKEFDFFTVQVTCFNARCGNKHVGREVAFQLMVVAAPKIGAIS